MIWYVRPRNTTQYGNGDGKSYDNAFNGLAYYPDGSGIIWGSEGVKAGDTLFVCDEHYEEMLNHCFYIGASGTMELPITIRGDLYHNPCMIRFYNFGGGDAFTEIGHFITFLNMVFIHFSFYTLNSINTYITFDGCVFRECGGSKAFFDLYAGADYWTFINNTFLNGQNGIYTNSRGGAISANYLTIKNNVFKHISGDGDAHAIGIQGASQGHVIEGNYIEDTGGAILFYNEGDHHPPMGDMIIRGNIIKNTRSESMGGGITVYDLLEYPLDGKLNYVIEDNVIMNTYGAGIFLSSIEPRPFKISNNIVIDSCNTGEGYQVGIGVRLQRGIIEGEICNNTIINPNNKFLNIGIITDKQKIKIDNNIYFSSTPIKKYWFGYDLFYDYQRETGFDKYGISADPNSISSVELNRVIKDVRITVDSGGNEINREVIRVTKEEVTTMPQMSIQDLEQRIVGARENIAQLEALIVKWQAMIDEINNAPERIIEVINGQR
jgi:hypothetical protein